MPILGSKKPMLLAQVQKQNVVDPVKLGDLIKTYDDLNLSDFRGIISDSLYNELIDASRDPNEVDLWNRINSSPRTSSAEIQQVQRLVSEYCTKYSTSPKAPEAGQLMNTLQQELMAAIKREDAIRRGQIEERDWQALEKGNYSALRNHLSKYPDSVHKDEIDDLMWTNTKALVTYQTLNRYLNDWPNGQHSDEAMRALNEIKEWELVKRDNSEDQLFKVDDYRDSHPDSPFKAEIDAKYYELRDKELQKMKDNPAEYGKEKVLRLINADIFKQWELQDEGLVTEESWDVLMDVDRDYLPNIAEHQVEDPNIEAPSGCTDVYLFGTPGTGKTCLLMGLVGANGNGYNLNMRVQGGRYASALQEYVNAGITPGRTYGNFVTTIHGQINETVKKREVSHNINFVEMSGEEFALRIADGMGVSLADMGTGATNLLRNNNRKVFFIIVDSTKERVMVEYVEQVKDGDGNVIDERIRKKYISQLDILGKFVSFFTLPENQAIMKNVDAIHFIVTKADSLGDRANRDAKARELLLTKYLGPVEALKTYCRHSKRINYSSGYKLQVFTFSLGKFFLGDVFKFENTDTLKIIDTIRRVTFGTAVETWWDKFKKIIG